MTFLVDLLGAALVLAAAYSLRASLRYLAASRRSAPALPEAESAPPATCLVVPCRGLEPGLEENLRALAAQRVPSLHLVFVVDALADPATAVIRRVMEATVHPARLVEAGPAAGRGQKVHNLLAAVAAAPPCAVLAFADSDGRPDPHWLGRLVAPLADARVGATTGYRFYLPDGLRLGPLLRSVWNAGVLTLLGDHDRNFAWGGSMALRREVFDEARVADAWRGALSDDYALTHAVRRAGYRIVFVPSCLVPSAGPIGLGELVRWVARQMAVTRVYWRAVWLVGGASQAAATAFVLLAPAAALAGDVLAAALLGAWLVANGLGGLVRARAAARLLPPEARPPVRAVRWAYALLPAAAAALTTAGFVLSALRRRIEWRGTLYEMRSPEETVVLGGDARRRVSG